MGTKQVTVIRADLKLRRGKECAQVAHAASMWMLRHLLDCDENSVCNFITDDERQWLRGNHRKIVVKATTEKQLRDLYDEAQRRGLTAYTVTDDGLTEVPPGTITALAIGPHADDAFVGLTDHLTLY
jgi:PTH2 family peptidyl-tRNA hydrolase